MFANFLSFPHNYCAKWLWCFREDNLAIWQGIFLISFNEDGLAFEGIFNLLLSLKKKFKITAPQLFNLNFKLPNSNLLMIIYLCLFLGKTKTCFEENCFIRKFYEKHFAQRPQRYPYLPSLVMMSTGLKVRIFHKTPPLIWHKDTAKQMTFIDISHVPQCLFCADIAFSIFGSIFM